MKEIFTAKTVEEAKELAASKESNIQTAKTRLILNINIFLSEQRIKMIKLCRIH